MMSVSSGPYGAHIHPTGDDIPDLTTEEKRHLESVRRKAAEFETEEREKIKGGKIVQGRLSKYTNVVMGWQNRWFILTAENGMFEYYMSNKFEVERGKPRGGIHLAGAVISPSDEDSYTFTVNAVCGEMYKLRAIDANERLVWINELRAVAQLHAGSPIRMPARTFKSQHSNSPSHRDLFLGERSPKPSESTDKKSRPDFSLKEKKNFEGLLPSEGIPTFSESLASLKICVDKAISSQRDIAQIIEGFPLDGANIRCSDTDLLLLKATSQALVQSLEYCYLNLLQRQIAISKPKGLPAGADVEWIDSPKPCKSP